MREEGRTGTDDPLTPFGEISFTGAALVFRGGKAQMAA